MPSNNRVLAVDDNAINLAVIAEALKGHFNLTLVDNGTDALRVASTFLPDVVLLDAMMPRPDGYEVCCQLRNDPALRHSKVIMVSAKTAIDDRLRGYQAGVDDYICKPFDEVELLAKVSAAMNARNLYRTMQDDNDKLCLATGDVLELLTHLRSTETGEHIDRIRVYAHLLAAELRASRLVNEIDDLFLDNLYHASALHDIGKIAIPDAIICKPGPLTNDEREEMKQHTVIGAQVLQQLAQNRSDPSFFAMASQIARSHHECFDGSGYPDGLCGEEIPLAARIVKVADVFDAITSRRVYKQKYEPQSAEQFIVRGKSTEFDPQVVDAMLSLSDEFAEVCHGNGILEPVIV